MPKAHISALEVVRNNTNKDMEQNREKNLNSLLKKQEKWTTDEQ